MSQVDWRLVAIVLAVVLFVVTCLALRWRAKWRREAAETELAWDLVGIARRDAMSAEARSRGVGGTGEHPGYVATPLALSARAVERIRGELS